MTASGFGLKIEGLRFQGLRKRVFEKGHASGTQNSIDESHYLNSQTVELKILALGLI